MLIDPFEMENKCNPATELWGLPVGDSTGFFKSSPTANLKTIPSNFLYCKHANEFKD